MPSLPRPVPAWGLRAHRVYLNAVEVFAPCYGDDFDAPHDTLTAFQDSLKKYAKLIVHTGLNLQKGQPLIRQ